MYCQYCGNEVDEDARFCRHCGKALNEESPTSSATEEPEGEQSSTVDTDSPSAPPDHGNGEDQHTAESDTGESETSSIRRVGYYIGRLIQLTLALLAVILLLGALNLNVLAFLVIAIVALVLFALIGVIELLVVRPLSS